MSAKQDSMSDFEQQVLSDLSVLKSQMQALLGNGQPGRMAHLEERVEQHEQFVQRGLGIGAFLALVLTLLHAAIDWLRFKR